MEWGHNGICKLVTEDSGLVQFHAAKCNFKKYMVWHTINLGYEDGLPTKLCGCNTDHDMDNGGFCLTIYIYGYVLIRMMINHQIIRF